MKSHGPPSYKGARAAYLVILASSLEEEALADRPHIAESLLKFAIVPIKADALNEDGPWVLRALFHAPARRVAAITVSEFTCSSKCKMQACLQCLY